MCIAYSSLAIPHPPTLLFDVELLPRDCRLVHQSPERHREHLHTLRVLRLSARMVESLHRRPFGRKTPLDALVTHGRRRRLHRRGQRHGLE